MANFLRSAIVRVPVSPTSAANKFSIPAGLIGVSNLTFFFSNMNPFVVRLEGTVAGKPFVQVSASSGWEIGPGDSMDSMIIGSKMPVLLSAMAFDTPLCPLPDAGYDYSNCYVQLTYGKGGGTR
jgi:hypothetical protein